MTFAAGFEQLTGHTPLRWQKRLYEHLLGPQGLPQALDLPTGLGKTSIMAIWYLALKAGARLPRRLVYVVDRRAVVDQATIVADAIKEKSGDATLRVSTLRGQHVDNRAWLEDPAASAIIVGTVDMIGSRLLFEGYGVSRRMRPYHAGLLGVDTLMVLDESHLVPPFELLLEQITERLDLGPKAEKDRHIIPRFRLLPLSATGRERGGDVFRLTAEDDEDPVVKQRLLAKKWLTVNNGSNKKLEEQLAEKAWELAGAGERLVRVLVYCNSRETAEKVKAEIEKTSKEHNKEAFIELFVGARRVKDRVDAAERLKALGFLAGSGIALEKPAFLIATSAGEVGVDLDADHMVCDLVPWERMVQRFGRVNRLGKGAARIIVVDSINDKLPDTFKGCAERCRALLDGLPSNAEGSRDVSPGALRDLKLRAAENQSLRDMLDAATTPQPLYPALSRPLVDAWSMTSLEAHTGRPEVQPWLRGWVEDDPPRTTVVWRKHLPVRTNGGRVTLKEISDYFDAAPPHLAETLETEASRVCEWLLARAKTLLEALGKDEHSEGAESRERPRLSKDSVVCIARRRGEEPKLYTLSDLRGAKDDKKRWERELSGRSLIVDVRVGGLKDGLLAPEHEVSSVSAADGEDGWFDPGTNKPLVPFRVRRVKYGQEEEAVGKDASANWQPIHAFDVERDADDRPLVQLVVEKWRGEAPVEDARSISSRSQSLLEHQQWAAKKARILVDALGLNGDLANAVVLAARLHDEGKKAARWQQAFLTPVIGRPYAKSASKRPPDLKFLGGYRHEFGSLFHAEKDNEFGALPDDLKDLVLHLIAAHHGRARPVIGTEGCDDGPPNVLEACARDVALRFARLQKRFGPWGLAWLEALVRAADQQASRDLDEGKQSDG